MFPTFSFRIEQLVTEERGQAEWVRGQPQVKVNRVIEDG
jgi:hypothetical protein